MALSAKPVLRKPAGFVERPLHWEERSASRVLEAGRDQILERSRRIVEAAFELLVEQGLEGLTIRAVLKRTGLSRRAFYERFAGKDDLMLAVFEETIRRAAKYIQERITALDNPVARLELLVTSIVVGGKSTASPGDGRTERLGAAMSREHLRLAESRPQDLQAAIHPLLTLIAEQLADGMQAGLVRSGDPQRLAVLLYNLVSTTVHAELLGAERSQLDLEQRLKLAQDIWEFCRRAITA